MQAMALTIRTKPTTPLKASASQNSMLQRANASRMPDHISVISLIGFVMLTGIIVNNGIVLVDYINQLRQDGMERRAAIEEAGVTRMRPILMTTITTVLGLVDMAVHRTAGTSLMKPVAIVCIGGLVYATLMTLFVVPCIYDMLNKKELRSVREEDLKLLDL